MSVFGHGRKRLDFTVIAQPWLRTATKHWVLEELPVRRGPQRRRCSARDHVNSIGVLGNSLRLHRPDEGSMNMAVLDRADIVAFLNRLKHQESAGGGACPFRFRRLGCGHFRSDPSYLPELRDYPDTLLRDRERIRAATELDDWARAEAMPSEAEITRLRQLIRRVEHDLNALDNDRQQIEDAVQVVRTRQTVHLGLLTTRSPALDPNLEGEP
jgi:hypothetical protein